MMMNAAEAQLAAERVMARCDMLAAISESPDQLTRVYLSPEHLRANAQVGEWMAQAGMRVWQDEVGNICGRYEGASDGAPARKAGANATAGAKTSPRRRAKPAAKRPTARHKPTRVG